MEMSLTEDFKTIDELRDDPDGILAQVISTGRPVSKNEERKTGDRNDRSRQF